MVAAASLRRVIVAVVAVIAGVLLRTEGGALNRIVTACFVVELVAHVVDRESDSLSEVRATIASVA
jgi:hypothetical protein